MAFPLPDGSNALSYDDVEVLKMDLSKGTKDLPGWSTSYDAKELRASDGYKELNEEGSGRT